MLGALEGRRSYQVNDPANPARTIVDIDRIEGDTLWEEMERLKMGMIVECNGQQLWSPSLQVGRLFADQMKAIERLVDQQSGVDGALADTMEIDAPAFEAFIQRALQTLEGANNGPLLAMAAGCLEVAIALNVKITGRWPDVSERLKPLVTHAQTVMQAASAEATPPPHLQAAG